MIKFEHPENGRYYYLVVEHDLFGDCVLSCIRGGIAVHLRVLHIAAGTAQHISDKLTELAKRRLQRGYTIVP